MNIGVIRLYAFLLLILQTAFGGREFTASNEDDHKFEKQIERLENATVKTIRTPHGDIYDCVDFYKQPAFSHPLVKNHRIYSQKKEDTFREKAKNKISFAETPKLGLNDGGCPRGTVPIRRVTKAESIRPKGASKSSSSTNDDKPASTHYARCRGSDDNIIGVAATLAVYNPAISDGQYSAAKMRLQIGIDSIEAGWRADWPLYGDNQTRLYVRTDVKDSHCFNTYCPGFVAESVSVPIDYPLQGSTPGKIFKIYLAITYEQEPGLRGWVLRVGKENITLGHWPDTLFLAPGTAATYVEWGGEVFGAVNVGNPVMGSGNTFTYETSAFFSRVQVITENTKQTRFVDPINVNCDADTTVYKVRDDGNIGGDFQYFIRYGGGPCYICE